MERVLFFVHFWVSLGRAVSKTTVKLCDANQSLGLVKEKKTISVLGLQGER